MFPLLIPRCFSLLLKYATYQRLRFLEATIFIVERNASLISFYNFPAELAYEHAILHSHFTCTIIRFDMHIDYG